MKSIAGIVLILTFNLSFGQIMLEDHNKAIRFLNNSHKLLEQKDYIGATEDLKKAIKLDSTIRDTYTLIYQTLTMTQDYSEQKKYLLKAKKVFTDDDEFCYYLGRLYQNEGKFDEAIAEYNEAVKFSKINGEDYPIVYDYYSSRGICYLKKELFSEAVKDFDYAIKLNNTKGNIYTNRGIALFKMSNKLEACESWRKALELNEGSASNYINKYCK
ncbi:MAG: tetratricopeptide repeat protein [Bacteroidota bacterium]|nr:tetratricopeptide repeat protein [Bacteroidota bacterium]